MTAPPLISPTRIYVEPAAAELPRGRAVLDRFPDAERVEVASHWRIPELHGDEANARRWVRIKREALVLGVKKSLSARPNGRSAHFIAPSTANGCAMACAYCYVPRRKGYSNPITVFANIEQITGYLARHVARQGPMTTPDQVDDRAWVYDIGENSDGAVDALVSDNVRDLVELFRGLPTAKASFATKYVNRDLLDWDPQGRTRVRFSLMPERTAKLLDIRTSPVARRLAALDDFVTAGYEVHVNLSPVVVHDGWLEDWAELLVALGDATSAATRDQLAAEVIMLTHNRALHEVNLGWHPRAEELLWRPDLQESKRSEGGGVNVRYRSGLKRALLDQLLSLIATHAPYLRVRYAF
ncbi:spore photoproduct lyase family protein [Saccharothrix coeruleofusca]|uniref:Spore photoproduct lyase family protein n=1 Tax=Saccharothrix coeruleofusca TaxID=33919 RepID=A0A918EFS1_9PSEU|nr:spore photoproduct lyase family protein [Saccharothrix coeruleofusca]MBP2335980.1 spore photoproduct lyase family protein [Saccharothrix coeruleofusca]GGP76213.1 spore photoproduct lyase family protein [Saccharothrix coeruleofusca]